MLQVGKLLQPGCRLHSAVTVPYSIRYLSEQTLITSYFGLGFAGFYLRSTKWHQLLLATFVTKKNQQSFW